MAVRGGRCGTASTAAGYLTAVEFRQREPSLLYPRTQQQLAGLDPQQRAPLCVVGAWEPRERLLAARNFYRVPVDPHVEFLSSPFRPERQPDTQDGDAAGAVGSATQPAGPRRAL